MARHAEWLQQVAAGLKALEQVKTPPIDRAMLEKLLPVYRRVAIRLIPCIHAQDLLRQLIELAQARGGTLG